jgi:hypothetical protein
LFCLKKQFSLNCGHFSCSNFALKKWLPFRKHILILRVSIGITWLIGLRGDSYYPLIIHFRLLEIAAAISSPTTFMSVNISVMLRLRKLFGMIILLLPSKMGVWIFHSRLLVRSWPNILMFCEVWCRIRWLGCTWSLGAFGKSMNTFVGLEAVV